MDVFDLVAKLTLDTSGYENSLNSVKGESSGLDGIFSTLESSGVAAFAGITAAVTATAVAVKEVAEYIWDNVNAVAELGDAIDKTSQKLGLSNEAYQEWDYVLQRNGSSIEQMRGGMKTLVNSLDSAKEGSESAIAKFERLGISIEEASSMSQEELFGEVVFALQSMTDETERSAAANDILGRSAMELAPLLNQSKEDTQALIDTAHEYGFVMSDEMVSASAAYEDSLLTMNKTIEGVKNNVFGTLLPGFTEAFDGIAKIISGSTDEGVEALQSGIENIATTIATELPGAVDKVADIFLGFGEAISGALPTVLESVASLVSKMGEKFSDLIPKFIDVILEIGSKILDYYPELMEAGNQLIVGLGEGFIKALPVIISHLPEIIEGLMTFFIDQMALMGEIGIMLLVALIQNLPDIIDALIKAVPEIITALVNAFTNSASDIQKSGERLFTSLTKDGSIIPKIVQLVPKIITGVISAIDSLVSSVASAGYRLFMGIIQNVGPVISNITGIAIKIVSTIVNSIRGGVSQMASVGANLITGLWSGISQQIGWLLGKIAGVASQVTSTVKKVFKVASPSKVFAEIGGYLAEGLAIGWEDGYDDVQKTINDDIDLKGVQNTNPVKFEYAGATQLAGAGGVGDIVIPVYIGQQKLDTIILNAQRRTNLKSGGRS